MSNEEFKMSFEQYLQTKQDDMKQEEQAKAGTMAKAETMLSQFGFQMDSIDWNDWNTISNLILNKVLPFYIKDYTDFICNNLAHKNEIFMKEVSKRTKDMLYQTNIGGKLTRGLLHITTFKLLREQKQKKKFTEIDMHNAVICCLMIEAAQSYCLVMDDVMDQSLTRRGAPCWYKQPNVGLKAINDGLIIESWIFWLLHHRLLANKHLTHLLDQLFRKTMLETQFGQMIDLELTKDVSVLKDVYTLKRYETIAKYKTSYYTFYFPYASALYFCGYDDTKITEDNKDLFLFYNCEQIAVRLGINFQIVDDYLDVYGDYEVMGKIGSDIEDFKCSWLLVQAIKLSNGKQYKLLQENYGKDNKQCIAKIKELYQELNLRKVYDEWEKKAHKELLVAIKSIQVLPLEMFTIIIDKLYKRNK